MARKKSPQKRGQPPQDFSNSPFKKLKGLSASGQEEARSRDHIDKSAMPDADRPLNESGDLCAFTEAMDVLGVRPLSGRAAAEPGKGKAASAVSGRESFRSREENDRAAFLAAVGNIEKRFKDQWPEAEPTKQAAPRRIKQMARGQILPEAELDLHGLTVAEAEVKVRFFLQDSAFQGFSAVLIITGKGVHSSAGPVLRQAVEKLLAESSGQVLEWGSAPRRYGGGGALVVFLRSRPG